MNTVPRGYPAKSDQCTTAYLAARRGTNSLCGAPGRSKTLIPGSPNEGRRLKAKSVLGEHAALDDLQTPQQVRVLGLVLQQVIEQILLHHHALTLERGK